MLEWYLPDRGVALSDDLRDEFVAMWRELLEKPAAAPRTWVMRDFHSPNLIWLGERAGIRASASSISRTRCWGRPPTIWCRCCRMRGSTSPSSSNWRCCPATSRRGARPTPSFDPAGFAELYAIMSAQRNTRLLGTFARLNRRDGKPQYLRHQPRIWTYLNRSLAHPALAGFRDWYAANVPPPVP